MSLERRFVPRQCGGTGGSTTPKPRHPLVEAGGHRLPSPDSRRARRLKEPRPYAPMTRPVPTVGVARERPRPVTPKVAEDR